MAQGEWGGLPNARPLRATVRFRLGNEMCQTGFGLRRTAANASPLSAIATMVAGWANPNFLSLLTPSDRLLSVDVIDVQSKEGAQVDFNNLVGTLGESAGLAPSILQIPVSYKSSIRARYGQGRGLWPIRVESSTDGNVISASFRTLAQGAVDALAAAFLTDPLVDGVHLINYHGPLAAGRGEPGGTPKPAVPASWYDVTSIRIGTVIGAVRSRKQGVGS